MDSGTSGCIGAVDMVYSLSGCIFRLVLFCRYIRKACMDSGTSGCIGEITPVDMVYSLSGYILD